MDKITITVRTTENIEIMPNTAEFIANALTNIGMIVDIKEPRGPISRFAPGSGNCGDQVLIILRKVRKR